MIALRIVISVASGFRLKPSRTTFLRSCKSRRFILVPLCVAADRRMREFKILAHALKRGRGSIRDKGSGEDRCTALAQAQNPAANDKADDCRLAAAVAWTIRRR
jgi:hypothetical protein